MKKRIKIILLFSILSVLLLSFQKVRADLELNLEYPEFGGIKLEGSTTPDELIAWLYYFIIGISGFSAFFMFVWGGFEWTSSMGNPSKIKEAQDRIKAAAIGLIVILSAYLILQVINPELTTFEFPSF